jgi:L-lactate dehydrogenase complex protein LldG
MSAREDILGKIARSRGASAGTAKPVPLRPALAAKDGAARLAQFCHLALSLGCTIVPVREMRAVPASLAHALSEQNLKGDVWLNDEPQLTALSWQEAGLSIHSERGNDDLDGVISVTGALAGLAETGAVIMQSSAVHPFAMGLLPDVHVAVLRTDQIVAGMEDIWPLARKAGGNRLPRALSLVGGPSRTGDIEATLVMGAHGPRSLQILLVGEEAEAALTPN